MSGGHARRPCRYALPALRFRLHQGILTDHGFRLPAGAAVLDFGCGAGEMVHEYRAHGYQAVGCDLTLPNPTEHVRSMDPAEARIPFGDGSFDFVFSDQVLEHARDTDFALREVRRVLKPGAPSLHVFPARWKLIEDHVGVPLAGVLRNRSWLLLWARLGVRNAFQQGMDSRAVAEVNERYLRNETRYLTGRGLRDVIFRHFDEVTFVERALIRHTAGRARHLRWFIPFAPCIVPLYRSFHCRAILLRHGVNA